ncbi:MAG: Kazal-type serine protease inhibitor domain-containing protein [Flavobacteriales bacterium]
MKKILCITALICTASISKAQDCVDLSLINPNAICPLIWAPVCGCDNVTYSNDCVAVNTGGVTSWTDGECPTTDAPQCADVSDVDFGPCDMWMGYAFDGITCSGYSGCGYAVGNVNYMPAFYESLDSCLAYCGSDIGCINQTQIEWGTTISCPDLWAPVCGCDDNTYSNSCDAYYFGGVTTYTLGECDDTTCLIVPAMVDFGDCEMPLGFVRRDGTWCEYISGCGYIGDNGYDYSEYFFESSYACLNFCLGSVVLDCPDVSLIDLNVMCPAVWEPVCGCDSVTYSNSCVALNHHGVWEYTPGECVTSVGNILPGQFSMMPNPANAILNIQMQESATGLCHIYDVAGRLQYSQKLMGQKSIQLNIETLVAGHYMVQICTDNGQVMHQKLMKQ